jgi:GNAT superfamily N-acetyltransferase
VNDNLPALVRRLERAQALQNDRLTLASGGTSWPIGGGFAHYRGPGHPLNQALGLVDAIACDELTAVESLLGDGGHPVVLELTPEAHADLWPILATRGYRVQSFQQLWIRAVRAVTPPHTPAVVRMASRDEGRMVSQLVGAGFAEQNLWRDSEPVFMTSLEVEGFTAFIASVDDEPAGAGMLGMIDGVALLSGDAVLPRFRGQGIQKALIHARLRAASAAGCDIACASTAPLTASQRSYESCGFRVAYPKIEMARG